MNGFDKSRLTGDLRTTFAVDDIEFVIDMSGGKNRRQSETNSFTLVKSPAVLNSYFAMANRMRPNSILEIGVFQGGSLVLLDRLFQPDTLIGVEIDPSFNVLTDYYERQDRNVNVYWQTSQADETAIQQIISTEFPHGIDLIIDDASHTYEYTRKSFELTWPHLAVGGTYIIEDWAWAHKPNHQDPAHQWHAKPAMSNLLFELLIDMASFNHIRSMSVDAGRAMLIKGSSTKDLLSRQMLRGRDFTLI